MMMEPKCSERECKHFLGVEQPGGDEENERAVCAAYPKGIPADIAYGDNPHTSPQPGDNGIIFEALT